MPKTTFTPLELNNGSCWNTVQIETSPLVIGNQGGLTFHSETLRPFTGDQLVWKGKPFLLRDPLPSKVNFHPEQRATVVYFGKDKQVVRATEDDEYNPTFGFLLAYFHYHSGLTKNKANEYLHSLTAGK